MFAGIAHCECGEKMYVPSNSPKYVCGKCRNKIAIVDLEGIFCDELQGYSFSADKIKAYLEKADETLVEKQRLLELQRSQLQKTRAEIDAFPVIQGAVRGRRSDRRRTVTQSAGRQLATVARRQQVGQLEGAQLSPGEFRNACQGAF